MAGIYDLDREELAEHLAGQPAYRVKQVWEGLYSSLRSVQEMSNLPAALRQDLSERVPETLHEVTRSVSDNGDTIKWLWSLPDDASVETVLMHYRDRSTVCVSSQAGCAMRCSFCATGQNGFRRHLSSGEIVAQVVAAAREAANSGRRLGNVVFMGMGEPLANYDALWVAIRRLHQDVGLSARHLTVSTVGIIPGIHKLAQEDLPVNLAVSLHAANDQLRSRLVPINKRYPIPALMAACRHYLGVKNRRLSFEWALINDVNDHPSDAEELAELARPLGAHVNLIPLNPTPGYQVRGSAPRTVKAFRRYLGELGINATIRDNRGTEIDAACGQLAASAGASAASREGQTPVALTVKAR